MGRVSKYSFITILVMAFIVPLAIMPYYIENIYELPKSLIILFGALFLLVLNSNTIHKIPRSIIVLSFLNLMMLFYTKNPYYTKIGVILNLSVFAVYSFTRMHFNQKRIKLLAWFIAVPGVLVSALVFFQFYGYYPFCTIEQTDIIGTIGNANYLGSYLCFPFFVSLGLAFDCRGKIRIIPLIFLAVLTIAIFIARARSSWVGILAGLIYFLFLNKNLISKKIVMYFLLMLLACSIYGSYIYSTNGNRIAWSKVLNIESLVFRYRDYIPPAIELIKQSPLFGYGIGSYRNQVYEAQKKIGMRNPDYFKDNKNPKPRRVHNDYIEFMVSGGVIYLLSFCFFIGRIFIRSYQNKTVLKSSFAGSVFCMLIIALFFFPFLLNISLFMAFVSLGVMDSR